MSLCCNATECFAPDGKRRTSRGLLLRRLAGTQPCTPVGSLWICLIAYVIVGCGRGNHSASVTPVAGVQSAGAAPASRPSVTLNGYVGGEKSEFLQNEKIRRILSDDYGLTINATKAGSLEMVTTLDRTNMDFVWPSNDFAVGLLNSNGGRFRKEQIVFNSPIVIYTGWNIANALIKEGLVEKRTEGYFIVRFPELLDRINRQTTWKDLGLPFHGKVTVRCTDPTRSNSGSMFAGLVAYSLNGGEVIDESSVDRVLPPLRTFFSRLGFMEHSSGDIFRKFIATGTTNSMVVGYENQIIEFIITNAKSRDLIENSVCVLYPEPTIWSSHPVVTLTERGDRLIPALMDERIQKLAWADHGFRSGLVGVTIDHTAVSLPFMPASIDSVIPLPSPRTFERILHELESL